MLASNRAWNLWFGLMSEQYQDEAKILNKSDRLIWRGVWGLWVVTALIAAAVIPFSARLHHAAAAIAGFCGFHLS